MKNNPASQEYKILKEHEIFEKREIAYEIYLKERDKWHNTIPLELPHPLWENVRQAYLAYKKIDEEYYKLMQ